MKNLLRIFIFIIISFDANGNEFSPFSREAIGYIREIISDHRIEVNTHRNIFLKFPDLHSNSKPIFQNLEDNDERKHFIANSPKITWVGNEARIPCNLVQYVFESKKFLYERYKDLRSKALALIEMMSNPENDKFESSSNEYEGVLKEISSILNLVEKSFPPEFSLPDRIATYTFSLSDEFNEIVDDPHFIPFGAIKITKIRFAENNWISFNGEIKGYMNFISNAEINAPDFFSYTNRTLDYSIELARELSPLEACLSDLKFEMIGHTGKMKVLKNPFPRNDFERFPGRPFNPMIPMPPMGPQPWPWGPAVDPMNPNYFPDRSVSHGNLGFNSGMN